MRVDGLIAITLAETHPKAYAGVLAACAVAGGTQRNFDYHANVRADAPPGVRREPG